MKPVINIPLLSLAQKIKSSGIKEINDAIQPFECQISRVGRSRHYQLSGEYDQLVISLLFIDSIRDSKNCAKWDRVYASLQNEITQKQNADGVVSYPIKNIVTLLSKIERLSLVLECQKYDIEVKRKAHSKHFNLVGSIQQLNTLQFQIQNQREFAKSAGSLKIAVQLNGWLNKRFEMAEIGFCSEVSQTERRTILSYIQQDPTISLSALCYEADCSIAEARSAFDEFEGF